MKKGGLEGFPDANLSLITDNRQQVEYSDQHTKTFSSLISDRQRSDVQCFRHDLHFLLIYEFQLLVSGQAYRVALSLEMPESPVNQALGMFMVKLNFYTRHGEIVHRASRAVSI